MSESAKINLVGFDKATLLENIEKIRAWDNNHNFPIIVIGNDGKEHYDTIDNVFKVINEDRIQEYLSSRVEHKLFNDNDPSQPEEKLTKEPIKPDSVHKGTINFEIRWYGKQAHIIIDEPDLYKRAAMLHQVHVDLGILLDNMRTNPKEIKKNFTSTDKTSVIKSRYLIDKFINSYLGRIWAEENMTEEERAKVFEKEIAKSEREIKNMEKEVAEAEKQLNDLNKQNPSSL